MDEIEYTALRNEIISNSEIINNYNLSTILASGTVFGFAFSNLISFSPYLFLIPLLFIIPNAFHSTFTTEGIIRIGSYIQVFMYSKSNGKGWESRLTEISKYLGPLRFSSYLSRILSWSTYYGLGILSLFAFYINNIFMKWYDWLLIILSFLLLSFAEYRLLTVNKKRKYYLEKWEMIKNNENQNQ